MIPNLPLRRTGHDSARLIFGAVGGVLLLALAGCGLKAYSDFDEEADFAPYQRFDFLPLQAPEPGSADIDPANSQLVARRVQREIERILTERGYRRVVGDEADFLIASQITTREVVERYPAPYALRPWYGGYDSYTYTEGTLVIDVVEAAEKTLVWHGWTSEPIRGRGSIGEVEKAVAAILARFPPGGTAVRGAVEPATAR